MIFVISGEGPTDFGVCDNGQSTCDGKNFLLGPIAKLVDQIVEGKYNYSIAETHGFRFFSKRELTDRALRLKKGNNVSLVGKKRGAETGIFVKNAWVLASAALEIEYNEGVETVAILFRDCDGTNSTSAQLWNEKWDSMMQGFARAGFHRGVPAIPKPISEAWLLCAAKENPYQNCGVLEELSGNKNSPHGLKEQLEKTLGEKTFRENLCDWLDTITFDHTAVAAQMPSYRAMRDRLLAVL